MRTLKLLLFSLTFISFVGHSESEKMFAEGYIDLPSHMRKFVENDTNHIRFFMDFNCIYCKTLHPFIQSWSNSLPKNMSFSFEAIVINDPMYVLNAAALHYIQTTDISSTSRITFINHIFANISKVSNERQLARLLKEAMADVGADFKVFAKKYVDGDFEQYLAEQKDIQSGINLQVTPTILIGGRYLTHLGFNKGEMNDFINLLNAVTSVYIYQELENGIESPTE